MKYTAQYNRRKLLLCNCIFTTQGQKMFQNYLSDPNTLKYYMSLYNDSLKH